MGSGTNIALSESISSQKAGIVLVWGGYNYNTGANKNYDYSSDFIPKSALAISSTLGWRSHVHTGDTGQTTAHKLLNITNESIAGVATNGASITANGATIDLRSWVLRSIIGV